VSRSLMTFMTPDFDDSFVLFPLSSRTGVLSSFPVVIYLMVKFQMIMNDIQQSRRTVLSDLFSRLILLYSFRLGVVYNIHYLFS
jgi:hypothetical protein